VWTSLGPDGGGSWSATNPVPFTFGITVLMTDPQIPGTPYVGTYGDGIFKSANAGATWTAIDSGLLGTHISALAIDPHDTSTLYASTASGVYVITLE
jgi:photosystem II stability/assembly factor-like uncharacterized protein